MFFKKRKKSLRIGSCDFCRCGSKFSKILIFVQKLKFHHQWQVPVVMKTTTKQGKVVFPEVVGSFCSFLRKCLPNSQVWITWSLSVFFFFFFKVKLASQEKSDQFASQLICQSILLWENYCISLCNWSALCVFPLASYGVLVKKGYTERARVNETDHFYCFIKDTEKRNWLVSLCDCMVVKNAGLLLDFSALLMVRRHQQFYP